VGFVQGNGAAQPQKAGQAVAAKPAGEEQAAAVAQGFQPAKAAGNGSVAGQAAQQVAGQKTAEQLQPSQPVVEQAAPDAQNKPEAAKPQLSTTDAPQQAVKPAPQAKPEGADNTAKPWDVQSQDAQPKAGANVAQGTQPAAYAQSVSTDDASKQSAQASPKPVEPTAFSDASQLPLAQASTGSGGDADAKGGTFFDGKGSEGADAGRLSSSKSDAPAQNADLQKGEFAQKLNATRGTARVDQAETIDKIVKSMTMAVKRGESEVRIMLQPARLGNVRIEMQVKDGVLNASFETQTQAARHAISNGLPQLKAALESQGIEVGGFNVSVEQESGQSKFTDERGTFGNFSDGSALLAGNEDEEDYDIFAEKQRMSAGTSLVDYFV
jgi:flagellar hook-length control protein FliK